MTVVANQKLNEFLRTDLLGIWIRLEESVIGKPFRAIKREIAICMDYLDGKPEKIIAHRHRCTQQQVDRIARKYGCPRRTRQCNQELAHSPTALKAEER